MNQQDAIRDEAQPGDSPADTAKVSRRGALMALTFGLWAMQFLSLTLRSIATNSAMAAAVKGAIKNADMDMTDITVRRLITCTFGALLCVALGPIMTSFASLGTRLKVALTSTLALAAGFVWSLGNAAVLIAPPQAAIRPMYDVSMAALSVNALLMFWVFMAWAGAWWAIRYGDALARREVELAKTELLFADAQNRMLRYQLNPHFMFNTLSALSTLILERDLPNAERVVINLSKFLRASLERAPKDQLSLREEVDIQEQYLGIERMRFEDRLSVAINLPEDLADCLVPSLILQPLVENAVKYAVAPCPGPVGVVISAQAAQGRLELTVRDTGPTNRAIPSPNLGVGLDNVRKRLALAYGDRAGLELTHLPSGGCVARVWLPQVRP